MKLYSLVPLALLGAMSTTVWAADASPAGKTGLGFTLQAGLTGGGDTLVTANFTNGESEDVEAGGFIYFGAGVDYRTANNIVTKLTYNYFVDDSTADNGKIKFQRYPVELTVGKEFAKHRIAGGFTRHLSPKLSVSSPNLNGTMKFEDADGVLVEYGYRLGTNSWVTLRYVDIDYTIAGVSGSADGSHFGIGLMGSF